MLYGMLSQLFVMRSMRKQLAGTIATAAAELSCWKVAYTVGLTAKLHSAAVNFDQPWLISGPMHSIFKLHFAARSC